MDPRTGAVWANEHGPLGGEIEHQTRRDTTTGEPRSMGERGATQADRVSEPSD